MLKRTLLYLAILCVCTSAKVSPSGHDQYSQFQAKLQTLSRSVEKDVHLGVAVVDISTGQVIFCKNEKHLFNPGSLVKLFTAAAALEKLGPAFTFETGIFSDEEVIDGRLEGNLYIKGSGDPSLTSYDIKKMLLALKQHPIHEVRGGFYIDASVFDNIEMGPGWMWDDEHALWQHPLSALTIDHNAIHIKLQKKEQKIAIHQNPTGLPIPIEAQIALVNPHEERNLTAFMEENQQITLKGQLPMKKDSMDLEVPVGKPLVAAGCLVAQEMEECGINSNQGFVGEKTTPDQAVLLVCHRSEPLNVLVGKMLKESDNLYANCIVKKLGHEVSEESGSWKNGTKAVRTIVRDQLHVDLEGGALLDGDGQSRYNYLSPKMVTSLLQSMQGSFHAGPEFMASLAIGGVDGTLKTRFQNPFLQENVRAKTGSLRAVSSIAGYIKTSQGKILAFTIIQNGAKDTAQAKEFEEKFIEQLYYYPR